jgi:hypothetical protein
MSTTSSFCEIPPLPPARGYESSATAELLPRYEDVSQDGRVQLMTLLPGLGAVWRSLSSRSAGHPKLESFRAQGILPILRRILVVGERGPFSVHVPIHCEGTWRLAREAGGDRILLNMWLDAFAPTGSTFGPRPAPHAERVLVGRVFAEHVVTRPFAPAAERKVTSLDLPGIPAVPEDLHPFEEAESLVEGRTLAAAGEHRFGMMHTDSNQHVNSLVYPRLFEEAVVRTLATRDDVRAPETLLARALELRYRKPFFAGDRAAIGLHLEPLADGAVLTAGAFTPVDSATKPSCTVAMRLSQT